MKTTTKKKKGLNKRFRENRNKQIIFLRNKGMGYAEIGHKLGMSRQFVRGICGAVDKLT